MTLSPSVKPMDFGEPFQYGRAVIHPTAIYTFEDLLGLFLQVRQSSGENKLDPKTLRKWTTNDPDNKGKMYYRTVGNQAFFMGGEIIRYLAARHNAWEGRCPCCGAVLESGQPN